MEKKPTTLAECMIEHDAALERKARAEMVADKAAYDALTPEQQRQYWERKEMEHAEAERLYQKNRAAGAFDEPDEEDEA